MLITLALAGCACTEAALDEETALRIKQLEGELKAARDDIKARDESIEALTADNQRLKRESGSAMRGTQVEGIHGQTLEGKLGPLRGPPQERGAEEGGGEERGREIEETGRLTLS